MSRGEKIRSLILGILMILSGIVIIIDAEIGYKVITLILCISLIVYGVRRLVYYFTMARHMVGGRMMLFLGIILLDAGVFILSLTDIPVIYVMLYLIVIHGMSGVIDILRAIEEKKLEGDSWKRQLIEGIVNFTIAVACIVFIRSASIAVIIYSIGLINTGIWRVIAAFRRSAVIYIQ